MYEGFTDWYAHLVPWWLGFGDGEGLLRKLEQKLSEYENRQFGRERSLVDAGGPAIFEDPSASAAVYSGGLALAALCDLAIARKDEGRSLNDLMRELNDGPDLEPSRATGLAEFCALLERYVDREFAQRIDRLARERGGIDLVAEFAAVGIKLERSAAPVDLSSLRANLERTTLTLVDSSETARLIGLRRRRAAARQRAGRCERSGRAPRVGAAEGRCD